MDSPVQQAGQVEHGGPAHKHESRQAAEGVAAMRLIARLPSQTALIGLHGRRALVISPYREAALPIVACLLCQAALQASFLQGPNMCLYQTAKRRVMLTIAPNSGRCQAANDILPRMSMPDRYPELSHELAHMLCS